MTDDELIGIKRLSILSVMMEEACLLFKDKTRMELKQRINRSINAFKSVQSYFINNPGTNGEFREKYKKEFLKSEIVLYSEIFDLIYGLQEADLEHIIQQLKENTDIV